MASNKDEATFKAVYDFLQIETRLTPSKTQLVTACPICGSDKEKFFVSPKTGLWECKAGSCGESGNTYQFFSKFHEALRSDTTVKHLKVLSERIPGTTVKGLQAAKAVFDSYADCYYLPHFTGRGTVVSLSKFVFSSDGKLRFFKPPNINNEIPAACSFFQGTLKGEVYVAEGDKDFLILLSTFVAELDAKKIPSILAVPSADTFKPAWEKLLKGKKVILGLDNDNAGRRGSRKILDRIAKQAKSVEVIAWVNDHPTGYDIGDSINESGLHSLDALIVPIEQWEYASIDDDDPDEVFGEGVIALFDDSDYESLVYHKTYDSLIDALISHPKLYYKERALRAIPTVFATAISTYLPGIPVWMFLVGPPSCGKTTIIDGLGRNNAFIHQASKFGPKTLISGAKLRSGADPSLLPRLQNRCLCIKDFTPILDMGGPVQSELFGVMRDAYDGHVSIPFGNGETRDYPDTHWSCIAGVTGEVRRVNKTAMGERFIRMNFIDPFEDHFDQTMSAIGDDPEDMDPDEHVELDTFIRRNVFGFFCQKIEDHFHKHPVTDIYVPNYKPRFATGMQEKFASVAEVAAKMRTNVSRNSRTEETDYRPDPELGSRLGKQFKKLAQGLAFIFDENTINEAFYPTIAQCAVDTSSPHAYEIMRLIFRGMSYDADTDELYGGASEEVMVNTTNLSKSSINRLMQDMHALGIVEEYASTSNGSGRGGRERKIWAMVDWFYDLWEKAFTLPKGTKIYR